MTDQTTATWTVAEGAEGEPTLWHGGTAVLRRCDLPSVRLSTAASYDLLWDILTRVLAPDEATLMELDRRVDSYARVLDDPEQVRACTEDILAALAGSGESE